MWTKRQVLVVADASGAIGLVPMRYNASHQRGWRLYVGALAERPGAIDEETPPTFHSRSLFDALAQYRAIIEPDGARLLHAIASRDCWADAGDLDRFVRRLRTGSRSTELVDAFLPIGRDEAASLKEQRAAHDAWQASLSPPAPGGMRLDDGRPNIDAINAGIRAGREAAVLARGELARAPEFLGTHPASIRWTARDGDDFATGRYSRAHRWQLESGTSIAASSSPSVVPLPWSDPAGIDPEEAFVAAVASCHMLWFLDVARRDGWVVGDYADEAVGEMTSDAGRASITRVSLRPFVSFVGKAPGVDQLKALHARAHAECFIANSVRSEVVVEPREGFGKTARGR